ncbi:MAG TPA: LPS export ABC transporter periplasmic protein LptC [Paracoccaceae bacterium]
MTRAGHDNLHSRLVAWLKIALPLGALALLSTLFLVSRTIDPSDAIPYADVDVEDRIRQPRMTAPTYAGVTSDGAALTVTADEARPDAGDGNGSTATALHARLATPDGARTDFVAQSGRLNTATRLLTLDGGVEITTSSGYSITTEALTATLDRTEVTSAGAIAAVGPPGQITAATLRITQDDATPGSYVLVFKDRVKLIYRPTN